MAAEQLEKLKSHSGDYFLERFDRLATNTVVAFTSILDEAIKKTGVSPTDSMEQNLQALFALVGLEEIKVNERQDNYDAPVHEAIRWSTEGDLESDKIIELVKRGFIFKGKVLRRALVIVRQ